jgi:glycosyltransferase involved in cell wall biosynthesis
MEINNPDIEILLPVHNEEASIEKVIREIYDDFSKTLNCQFIICEDGSKDNTKEVITRLSREIPMKLVLSADRKGYTQAVKDGMVVLSAPFLLCLDSDGQCDPKDFWRFWEDRNNYDVILGWRVKRQDVFWRLLFSRIFYYIYQVFFNVPFHDPSCPFMLAQKHVVEDLAMKMGDMQEGFWWEFSARVILSGYKTKEIKVNHRRRFFGKTQVYRLNKVTGIGYYHFLALFKISKQMKNSKAGIKTEK